MKVLLALACCLYAVVSTANQGSSQIDVFDALDDYSLLDILDYVNSFGDLATVASMSSRVHQLIRDRNLITAYNISNAALLIEIVGNDQIRDITYRPVGEWRFKTLCTRSNHLLATLKAFCPMFGELHIKLIYVHGDSDFLPKVVDYVNQYCSTVPQTFTFTKPRYSALEFTALNVSSVRIIFPEIHTDLLIAKHFPRVKELYIINHDYYTTTEHLPHLKHLELVDNYCGHFNIRAFGEKNPQITSVKLELCDGLDVLQEVNEAFPNLESLYYKPKRDTVGIRSHREGYTNTVRTVRFQNVKSYTIDLEDYFYFYRGREDAYFIDYFAELELIEFDQLETFKYISGANFFKYGQLNYIGQYKDVKSLDYSSYRLSYGEVRHLVDLLPNLQEISIKLEHEFTDRAGFLRLIQDDNLKTVRIWTDNRLAEENRAITLPGQWLLHMDQDIYEHATFMIFKRK